MDETDFPRGKYATFKDSTAKKIKKRSAEDELFSTRMLPEEGEIDGKSKKKTKRLRSKKSTSDEPELPGVPSFKEKIIIYRLKVTNVAIGSIILGCVTEIKDFELSIQLPGAVMVKIAVTNISDSYNKVLGKYTAEPSKYSAPPKPKSLFSFGDLLPVKILDKNDTNLQFDDTSMSLVDINASINPKDVYSDVNTSLFMKNCLHSSISAAVIEIEDNGYLMDIGKENIQGFLDFEGAKPFLESRSIEKLQIGQVLMCNVTSASPRVIKLTTKPVKIRTIDTESTFPASCLLPGSQVSGKILGINEKGLEIVIFGQHRGFVHRDHLNTIWDLPRDDYQIGAEITGTILFVNPINKVASVSLRSSTISTFQKTWSKLKVGQIINGAQIVGKDSGDAFIFKFPNGFKGVAPKGELSDEYIDTEDFSIMEGKMPIGSSHKCRIKSFSYLDGFARVTLKPSLLNEELLSIEDLSVGQVVEGRVKKLIKKGLIINLGFAVKAICPPMHHKESATAKDYKSGAKIKCRIIRLDNSSLLPRIAVTCKKEIIREQNIIDDISKAEPGVFTRGVVVLIKSTGLLVEFFNNLRGWLSASRIASEGQKFVPSLYSVGQVLPVYIIGRDLTTNRIHVSLTYNETPENNASGLELGTILTGLTVDNKDDNGFLLVNSEGSKFYLPKNHLTDFPVQTDKVFQSIDEADTIAEVVVFNNTQEVPVVSRRRLFIHAAKTNNPVFKPDSLNTDLVIPAIIVNVKHYGLMIECPNGLLGLIPSEFISEPEVDPFECKIPIQQTILVHIMKIKEEPDQPKRLNCSAIISQCSSEDFTPERVLLSYLSDYFFISSKLNVVENSSITRSLSLVKPGNILSYKVMETNKSQILVACSVPGRKKAVPGIIITPNIGDKDNGKKGHTGEAVVLYVDIEKRVIHLTANEEIVKNSKSAIKASSYSKVRPGQCIIGLVQLITDKFYVVSLRGHAIGAFAYIPRLWHLNQTKYASESLSDGEKLYFEAKVNHPLDNGERLIIGYKTTEKPTAVKNKEAAAAQAKELKEQRKRELRQATRKTRSSRSNDDKENDDEVSDVSSENGDDDDGSKPGFIIDKDGNRVTRKRLRKPGDTAGPDEEGSHGKTSKRNRKISTSQDAVKERKAKHFKKIQSLASDRVKSAVAGEELFFWDTVGDPKLADTVPKVDFIVESEARSNLPAERESATGPLSKEEFENLIVQSPNDIDRWCRYINYYIGQGETDKAKELCERALETIDHKLEDGKLRIWSLKLRIEYKHGTPESLSELTTKALCANDEIRVYKCLVALYEEDGKTELAESTFREATKKQPLNKSLWVDFGRFYLKHGRISSFRDLVQRAINYMEKKEQLDLIIKFAQLECQSGDLERAKTMFEAALVNFSKRTDIWSIYIDMMIKYGLKKEENGIIKRDSIESIRLLFDRATAIKVKEKKIRFLFKKYIDFEQQYGDEEKIAAINKKISEYVDANDIVNQE